jgi:hypothetical protein
MELGTRWGGMGSSSSEKGGCGCGHPLSWHSPVSQPLRQHPQQMWLATRHTVEQQLNKAIKMQKTAHSATCLSCFPPAILCHTSSCLTYRAPFAMLPALSHIWHPVAIQQHRQWQLPHSDSHSYLQGPCCLQDGQALARAWRRRPQRQTQWPIQLTTRMSCCACSACCGGGCPAGGCAAFRGRRTITAKGSMPGGGSGEGMSFCGCWYRQALPRWHRLRR